MAISSFSRLSALAISVDLEVSIKRAPQQKASSIEAVAAHLLRILGQYSIPATWTLADPTNSPLTDRIRQASGNHEIALLGDPGWLGADVERTRVSSELSRRVLPSRGEGISISTLVNPGCSLKRHWDLLVKAGITSLRNTPPPAKPSRTGATSLRYGLWEMAPTLVLPITGRWSRARTGSANIRRAIDRTMLAKDLYQIVLDVPQLATASKATLRTFEQIVLHAAQRREELAMEVLTLGEAADRLSQPRAARPARSILKVAA